MGALSSATGAGAIALVYLARGADDEPTERFQRFVQSYKTFRSGLEHDLFVIFKGFNDHDDLVQARGIFANLSYTPVYTDDENFDIGAYRAAAETFPHERICFLNSNSQILCDDWLAKLVASHAQRGTGMACATGSFESLWLLDFRFPRFPNVHARSNAFIMYRKHVLELLPRFIADKKAAFFVESGSEGLTRRIFDLGLSVVVVGRNGRSYSPQWWPSSFTFRQGAQHNLIVHDNVSRAFESMTFSRKKEISHLTWGKFIQDDTALLLPAI